MKKLILILLCAALAFGAFFFPDTALAADYWTDGLTYNPSATFDGGTGTSSDPYIIDSETALAQLAINVNGGITYGESDEENYFRLNRNLDLTDKLWMPIGIYRSASINNQAFKGTFDGNDCVISNLTVNEPAMRGIGLFGYAIDALIEDLGVENCDIDGQGVAGGLVGFADKNCSIHRCYSTGSVKIIGINYEDTFDGTFAGGLVGIFGDAPSTIDSCYSSADVDGDDSIGGLVGAVDNARVINSYATGRVGSSESEAYPAGGFVGFCEEANIEQCYATGNVISAGEAGGFVGDTSPNGAGSTMTNCYARGDVSVMYVDLDTGDSYGWVAGSFAGSVSGITISNCYGTGNVITGATEAYHMGGFVGEKDTSDSVVQFNSCFFNQEVTERDAIGNKDDAGSSPETGITGLTTANMQGYDTLLNTSKMDALDSGSGEPVSDTLVWYPHSADYPDFEPESCTITFDSQFADTEASPTSKTVTLGYAIGTLPANPIKSQYFFCGWYTAPNGGGTKITASDAAPGTINVYAKWEPELKLISSLADGKLALGNSFTLTPNLSAGTWSYIPSCLLRSGNTFTGMKTGLTRITYSTAEQSASYNVKVVPYTFVGIKCTASNVTVYGGSDGSVTIIASGGNSDTYEYSLSSGSYDYSLNNGTWQSTNVFSGLAAGTYTAAVREASKSVNKATCSVTIGQPSHMGTIPAKKIPSKVNAGTAVTLTPPAAPRGYTLVSVSYTSRNPSVAAVDAIGNVTFLAGGKAAIITKSVYQRIDSKGKLKTKTITVKKTVTVKQSVASVSLNLADATVMRTQKVKLTAVVSPATASNKKLTWKSSNPKVASVSSAGVVKGKTAGTAVITCTARDGSRMAASCTVTVLAIQPTGLKLSKAVLTVKTGRSASLKAKVLPKNTDFKTVTFMSSNPAVATVNAKGKVKAIAPGTVTITATSANGLTASCTVTVK